VDGIGITRILLATPQAVEKLQDLMENSFTKVFVIIYDASLRRSASSVVFCLAVTSQFFEKPKFPDNSSHSTSVNITENSTQTS